MANISEGRDSALLSRFRSACSPDLLDVHVDAHHHRSVFTLVGETAVRQLTERAVEALDLRHHLDGVHPRLGVVDVVPFVPLSGSTMGDAADARQSFAEWVVDEMGVPCFLYGPAQGSLGSDRTLPEIRSSAWSTLLPDLGPSAPHSTAGAICVGARRLLVAYNIWMHDPTDGAVTRDLARSMRSQYVRTLALRVGSQFQVSMNLVEPEISGPAQVHRRVSELCRGTPATIERCELVGLIPESVLDAIDPGDWSVLGLSADQTIESALRRRTSDEPST